MISFTGLSALLNVVLPFNLDYFSAIILFGVILTILSRGIFLERFMELLGR